jgi:hypothetical protein
MQFVLTRAPAMLDCKFGFHALTFKWWWGELDGVYLNACCCWAFKCPLFFGVLNNNHFIKNLIQFL